MHRPLKFLSFAAATLLLSLSSPRAIFATSLDAAASNTNAQNGKSDKLPSENLKAEAQQLSRDGETELQLIDLGNAYNSLEEYEQAVESAKNRLALAQTLENDRARAAAFVTLARTYQSMASSENDYYTANRTAVSGLTTAWKVNDYDSEAKALAILGNTYNALGNTKKAWVFAKRGLNIAKENNIQVAAASSLLTLASVYLEQGKYQNAIESAKEGTDILRQLELREAEGATSVMQALAYLGRGNVQKALELADVGLTISQEIKSSRIEALALIVSSLAHSRNGNEQKAIELINQSQAIAKAQKNPELETLTLEVLGEIYRQAGRKQEAIVVYQEAISRNDGFSALAGVARIYQESNLSATAIAYYKRAVNKNEEHISRKISGLPVWLQASFPQAIQDVNGLGATNVYRSFTNLLLAQTRDSEAVQVVELLKGQELSEYTGDTEINAPPFGQSANLTITPTEEQIIAEYGSLIEFGNQINVCQQASCPQLEQLLEQRTKLTERYYQALEELEAEIQKKRAADEAFIEPNQFIQKAQTIVEAQPNTVLIYPIVLDDRIWLMWAAQGGIFKSVEVTGVTQAQLEETVMKFRQSLQNRLSKLDDVQARGKQLYDWLVKPIEGELKANNIENLVFALDRSTRYVPMSTLFDGEKFLIENYTVSTVLSANLTDTAGAVGEGGVANAPLGSKTTEGGDSVSVATGQELAEGERAKPTILAMGVSEAVGGFRGLPHVPPELDAIVLQGGVDPQGIYRGQEFLDGAFDFFTLRDNLPNHQVLHIATHSKFVPGRASQSFLLLGTGDKLAVPDIERWLNLRNVNLVVLSACETALGGAGMDGREIAGVGYYFLKSGANTVMASLWNVDDRSTRLLMELFYENLAKGTSASPITIAKALRQAQLALLKGDTGQAKQPSESQPSAVQKPSFRHPYYWAPFILMGSGL